MKSPIGAGTANPAAPDRGVVHLATRDLRTKAAILGAVNLVHLAWLVFRPAPYGLIVAVTNIVGFIGPLIAAFWCLPLPTGNKTQVAGKSVSSGSQRAPALLGVGILCFALGEAVWAFYELILKRTTPFPSWSDAFYLAAYPAMIAGVFRIPSGKLSSGYRGRVFMDCLMMAAALVTFSWFFVLGPIIFKGTDSAISKALGIAYPLADLAILICLLRLSAFTKDRFAGYTAFLMSAGLLSVVVSDTCFAYLTLKGTYSAGYLMDAGWTIGYMLVGLGGRALRWREAAGNEQRDRGKSRAELSICSNGSALGPWRAFLPYLVVPAVIALALFTRMAARDDRLELGVWIGSVVLIILLVVRQIFVHLENSSLYRNLHQAYQELEIEHDCTAQYAHNIENANRELTQVRSELEHYNSSLAEANEKLQMLATTDGMTNLANHRLFQERLRVELKRGQRYRYPVSIVLIDVDRFKHYNDTFGHPAGDEVLRILARLLELTVREIDLVARYGGEEFAMLLPQCELDGALIVAERIRNDIFNHKFPHRAVTASIGISVSEGEFDDSAELIARADSALYAAKRAGRNRVVAAESNGTGIPMRQNGLIEWMSIQADVASKSGGLTAYNEFTRRFGGIEGLLGVPAGEMLASLLALLELRGGKIAGQCFRVATFSLQIARALDAAGHAMDPGELRGVAFGALLHDIGKLCVPESILLQQGEIDAYERDIIQKHTSYGAELAGHFDVLNPALPVIRSHQERWDGKGYPAGLRGEEIPVSARIVALAVALEAMLADRPYRAAKSVETARQEIERLAGKQFDPTIVEVFLTIPTKVWRELRITGVSKTGTGAIQIPPAKKAAAKKAA